MDADLEARTLATLGQYNSLAYPEVVNLVLKMPGCYTWQAELDLRNVLQDLVKRGTILAPSPMGPYRYDPASAPSSASTRPNLIARLRSRR
jgi:hypothetical protein